MATKKVGQKTPPSPLTFGFCWIRDGGKSGSGIRNTYNKKDLGEKTHFLCNVTSTVLKKRSGSVVQWYGFGIRNTWSMGKKIS
jgi:hypothetical protein